MDPRPRPDRRSRNSSVHRAADQPRRFQNGDRLSEECVGTTSCRHARPSSQHDGGNAGRRQRQCKRCTRCLFSLGPSRKDGGQHAAPSVFWRQAPASRSWRSATPARWIPLVTFMHSRCGSSGQRPVDAKSCDRAECGRRFAGHGCAWIDRVPGPWWRIDE